jgi:hypothetical protein
MSPLLDHHDAEANLIMQIGFVLRLVHVAIAFIGGTTLLTARWLHPF